MMPDEKPSPFDRMPLGRLAEGQILNIGSHPENDLAVAGQGLLPFHAVLQLAGSGILAIPANPNATILFGSESHASAVNLPLNGAEITLGSQKFFVRGSSETGLVSAVALQIEPVAATTGTAATSQMRTYDDDVILVNLVTASNDIQVEQPATYQLEVVNAGPIVASFSAQVVGVPAEWVEITPANFNLNEGKRATLSIRIIPPRKPTSTAGTHPLSLVITSANYPGYQCNFPLTITIQPFNDFIIGNLEPRQQSIGWTKKIGKARLPITNLGNGESEFALLAMDDENGCAFNLHLRDDLQVNRQANMRLGSGVTYDLPISIQPHKHPVFAFSSHRYQYNTTISINNGGVSQQMASGSVVVRPLFGWWSIVLGILAILLLAFVAVQPRINSYLVAGGKDIIQQGDTTRLEWSVSPFATRLNISNVTDAITYGQTSLTVQPQRSTAYELVAGNWLSGLVGLDQKSTQTVLVVPPVPTINVFEVDSTYVPRGKAVNLRWSITQADKAVLNIGGVVTELTPDKFSGMQSVVLDKNSIVTLEASNASGTELKSYYVNVVDPFITVQKFTVWVRPLTPGKTSILRPVPVASTNAPHTASLSPNPVAASDSFTEKYVELIPDKSSDMGYRVQFYQPERELSKGEQVMIEWNVVGTDSNSVQIAPFTDVLPNSGRQPFFPQESMNFVLSAQSGEQKKLFMLPVVVFDGTPPTAPKIDIFKASPMSMLGSGSTQFAWSVSGEWTKITLANGKGIVGDNLNPQGFKSVGVGKSDTFILTAWNGSLSSSQALDITVNPALIQPGLTITKVEPTTARFLVGGKITVTVAFTKIPTNKPNPTGSVTVTDGNAICSITLPATSCDLIFKTSGMKTITASFPGDAIYMQSNAPNYAQQIEVASSTVDLTPTFFFKGGTTPIAVESSTFDIDKGMQIRVEVRPKNTILADNNGNIAVSVCDQLPSGGYDNDTCVFVGSAQVKVATETTLEQTSGYGYANIVIQNFSTTGLKTLLFEYTHSSNAIDPAQVTQPNVQINRARLLLSLASCADPYSFTSCTYGLSTTVGASRIIFDLSIPGVGTPLPLSSLLPRPSASAFTLTSTPSATWSCFVSIVSGTYKLVCDVTGLAAGTNYTVNYAYNNTNPLPSAEQNHYYMGGDPAIPFPPTPFQLRVLTSTKITISSLAGIRVGERVYLTGPTSGGILQLMNNLNQPISTSAGMSLEEKSGKDIFGIVDEGINCKKDDANPAKILITAANANCFIYFTHVGSYTLVAKFDGDTDNNASVSGDTPVSVQKQTSIDVNLQHLNSSNVYAPFPSAWTRGTNLLVRAELSGPNSLFSPPDTTFPSEALFERKLLLTLGQWAATNCTVQTDALVVDKGSGVYEVEIQQKPIGDLSDPANQSYITAADFTVRCDASSALGLSFTLAFSDKTDPKDSDDFAFSSPNVGVSDVRINEPSLGTMTVTFTRQSDAPKDMLNGTTNLSELHFGQKYDVAISGSSQIPVPYSYYVDYTYTYSLPFLSLYWNFDWSRSADPAVVSLNTRNGVVNQYTNYSKWAFDPSNFLSKVANLDKTTESTCGTGMSMKATGPNTAPTEYASQSLISYNAYWSGLTLYRVYVYRVTYYGTLNVTLKSANSCMVAFDSTTSTNTPFTSSAGVITVSAASPGTTPLFNVNNSYTVASGIDKQNVNNMAFTPSAPAPVFVGGNVAITAKLSSADITNGTDLPFITSGLGFTSLFSPTPASYTGSCTGLSRTDLLTTTGVTQTFTSTAPIASTAVCNLALQYLGNRYYHGVGPTDNSLPDMAFLENAAVTLSVLPASPSTYGTSVTLTANTTPTSLAGSVTFKDGTTTLGTATVTSGVATFSTSALTIAGSPHSLTAVFTPSHASYSPVTSSAVAYTITSATTTTSLTTSVSTASYGTSITLTAAVTPNTLAGSVTFKDGATTIGTGTVSSGSATLAIDTLDVGGSPHSLTAVFTPTDTNYTGSTSSAKTVTISTATSTTTLSASPASTSVYGNDVVLTATVPTKATGTVTFKTGSVVLGTATVTAGSASYTTAALDVVSSPHSLTAVFAPDNTNYSGSTSSAVTYTITAAPTTVAQVVLVSPAAPYKTSDNLTFQVTVTSDTNATPLGTVEFFKKIGGVTTSIGTYTVSSATGKNVTYTLNNVKLTPAGTYEITATYTPATSNLLGSNNNTTPLSVVVQ